MADSPPTHPDSARQRRREAHTQSASTFRKSPRPASIQVFEECGSDEQLMLRIQADDHQAFEELLPRIVPAVDARLRQLLPPWEMEDVRAEVMLHLWAARKQYCPDRGRSLLAWVRRIASNAALDWLRQRKKHRTLVLDEEMPVVDAHSDPAAAVERADWIASLQAVCAKVLQEFPEYVNVSWYLRLEGCSFRDISGIVGRPIGSIAGALFRVRARIVAWIHDRDNPDPLTGGQLMSADPILGNMSKTLTEIKEAVAHLEQQMKLLADMARAQQLLDRVRKLIQDGETNADSYRSDTNWAEVFALLEELRMLKRDLPGLYRKTSVRLKYARERLQADPQDCSGLFELKRVEQQLEEAIR